jgi:basic membrane lipoprotein Med (substrate-binding protein (PBP1-ABC) superfamily)
MARRRHVLKGIGAGAAGLIAGCAGGGGGNGNSGGSDGGSTEVSAAFVHNGQESDQGWTYTHEQARQDIEEDLNWVSTSFRENIGAPDAEEAIINEARRNNDIVFTTSVTFQDATASVAEQFPDTRFANANGLVMNEQNMGRYTYRLYEPSYASGIVAGQMTDTNVLGYVGSLPQPLVFRDLNSFALGAQSVNPDITVKTRWTNAFFAPQDAQTIVDNLIDNDVDAFAGYMDSAAVSEKFASEGVYGRNWASRLNAEAAGEWSLGVPVVNWDAYYRNQLNAIRDGSWEPSAFWGGLESGMVELTEPGSRVSDDAIAEANEAIEQIQSGELRIWDQSKFADQIDGRPESGGFVETQLTEYVDPVEGQPP